jgi:release factor glutamine methyltransferase
MNAGQWLKWAEAALGRAELPFPSRDALLLLAHALGRDKAFILAHLDEPLSPEEAASAELLLARRSAKEPIQYIRGVQEFWGMPVKVGPGCLIPRPETEHLVEQTLIALEGVSSPAVAEVGAGSGCVLMALWVERPDALLVGLEKEAGALVWARRNLAAVPGVMLARADLAGECPLRELDALVSNPPYISDGEWEALPDEVRVFEPEAALRSGPDPLGPYRRLARWAAQSLKPGGFLLCELGQAQAKRAAALRSLHPEMAFTRSVRDLAGRLRVAVWQRRG